MNIENRIKLEKRIVRKLVRALLADGYDIAVDNGGDEYEVGFTDKFTEVINGLFACDEEFLVVQKVKAGETRRSMVHLIYGNDGWDVICDYSCSLESIVDPISDWASGL
jgi:hypothetical protein